MPPSVTVRWNGVTVSTPLTWQSIVRENRHLIFERDVTPMLEIRWDSKSNSSARSRKKMAAKLGENLPQDGASADIADWFKNVRQSFTVHPVSLPGEPAGALLYCRTCQTPFLVKIFDSPESRSEPLLDISCNCRASTEKPWLIHDLSFVVPEGFSLTSSSFQFGLTLMVFHHGAVELRLVKVAPASARLKRHTLAELFAEFCECSPADTFQADAGTVQYVSAPSPFGQIRMRLRRRKPFIWARFTLDENRDRIIGFTLRGKAPFAEDLVTTVADNYRLV
jgi:hypothetical protein